MNKKVSVIILVLMVTIIGSFGGYKTYAHHMDNKQYQAAQTAINQLFSDKNHKILSNHVNDTVLETVKKQINLIEDKENKMKLLSELKRASNLLRIEDMAKSDIAALLKDGILQDDITNSEIEKTQKKVNSLTDDTLREHLQKTLDLAIKQLTDQNNVVSALKALFTDETHTALASQVNRETYNKAKQLIDGIQNEKKKNELTILLASADGLLQKEEKEQAEAKAKEEEQQKLASNTVQTPNTTNIGGSPKPANSNPVVSSVQQVTGFAQIVANSKTAQRTDQIVTVVAGGTSAKVTLWEKNGSMWNEIFTTNGFVGSQGVGQASEGSKRTPKGAYTLGFAFGQSNPGTILPFRQITPNSYWISDINSDLYNTWQEGSYAGNGNEHLADYKNLQYYYAIVINYNMNRIKGAGSAFFLHVSNGRPTAGCVSVPRSDMEKLMKRIHPGAYIMNVTSQNEVFNY